MKRMIVILSIGSACVSGGCWAPRGPETNFSINPITKTMSFHDTKDNDVEITGAGFNAATHDFKLEKLTIKNSASSVIQQQALLMERWNTQMQTANQGLRDAEQMFIQGLGVVAPGLNARLTPQPSALQTVAKGIGSGLATRIGGQPTAGGPDVAAALTNIGAQLDAIEQQVFQQRAALTSQPSK